MAELSRFTNSGKTFFLNEETNAAGNKYLSINTMYGKPTKYEKMSILVPQLVELYSHLRDAIGSMVGLAPSQPKPAEEKGTPIKIPFICPNCEHFHIVTEGENNGNS